MKRAIIMGASSGMGREVAKILLADDWCIGIAARRLDKLNDIKSINPNKVHVASIDITTNNAPDLLLNLINELGGVDLYLHFSGIGNVNIYLKSDIELNTVNTNALGFTRMIDAIYNYMSDKGGHIAIVSSIAGTKGLGPAPSYSATKAFQNTYIQALEQLSISCNNNISFTDIRPGYVDTDLLEGASYPMTMDKQKVAKMIVKAVYSKKHIKILDWRYRLLTFFWKIIPLYIWRHINLARYCK